MHSVMLAIVHSYKLDWKKNLIYGANLAGFRKDSHI